MLHGVCPPRSILWSPLVMVSRIDAVRLLRHHLFRCFLIERYSSQEAIRIG